MRPAPIAADHEAKIGSILTQDYDDRSVKVRFSDHHACIMLTGLVEDSCGVDSVPGLVRQMFKGDLLWTAVTGDHLIYFLRRGQVVIMLDNAAGCEVIVRVIQPGEPFGELCFCSRQDQPREDCAQAVVDSEVVQISLSDFLEYLRRNAGSLEAFTFTLCERLADAEKRIAVLSYRGAEARLARLLLQLARSRDQNIPKPQGGTKLHVGHEKLAHMAAMTRPHVSVIMSRLRSRGLVHYDRGSVLTVDTTRLTKYLDEAQTKPVLLPPADELKDRDDDVPGPRG